MQEGLEFKARRLGKDEEVVWNPKQTAVVIVDMWDQTICKSAQKPVAELTPKINEFIVKLRKQGVLVVHAPFSVMKFYEGTPERALAENAPFVEPPVQIDWQDRDPSTEGPYPVESEDWCDDTPNCNVRKKEVAGEYPWTRQIESIGIEPGDAVSDNGQEIFNLFVQKGIKNVFVVGVHLSRCVLGRPYGIRQLVKLGYNTVLVRDLTEDVYDPRSKPHVSHEQGLELLVEHVEKYWCGTAESGVVVS